MSDGGHEQASGPKPTPHAAQERRLLGERQMDEREEAGDRAKARVRELHRRHVHADEGAISTKLPGAPDLTSHQADTRPAIPLAKAPPDRNPQAQAKAKAGQSGST